VPPFLMDFSLPVGNTKSDGEYIPYCTRFTSRIEPLSERFTKICPVSMRARVERLACPALRSCGRMRRYGNLQLASHSEFRQHEIETTTLCLSRHSGGTR